MNERVSLSNPVGEARSIARLVKLGLETAEGARALIAIKPDEVAVLARILPDDRLRQTIEFRAAVLRQFEKLVEAQR